MEPSESVTAAGQSIATFVPAALVPAFLLAFLVVCAWAQLIAPKAKTARRSVIRYRFMERFPSKVEIGDELRDRPKGFMAENVTRNRNPSQAKSSMSNLANEPMSMRIANGTLEPSGFGSEVKYLLCTDSSVLGAISC